ncbi:hypothetical protein IG631_14822 [Alternaria alternata]|nr:hypothetical protein IG631_14822 [Alternaria alternata]
MATNQASDKAEEEFFEPREIVRVFSMSVKAKYGDDSEEESELEKALVSKLDDDEGQRKRRIRQINEYLNSTKSEELIKLGQQRCALEAAMQEFRVRVQKAQPQDVISQKIDSWDDVTAAVERMMSRFKEKQDTSKFRRATKILRTFCNTVNAHSTALKLLPINNDYVTIFYGALATALQVRSPQGTACTEFNIDST